MQAMMGPLAGFVNLWLVFFLDVASAALLAKTAALYILRLIHIDCHEYLQVMVAIFLNGLGHFTPITTPNI